MTIASSPRRNDNTGLEDTAELSVSVLLPTVILAPV